MCFSYFLVSLVLFLKTLKRSLSLERDFGLFLVSLGESNLLSDEFLCLDLLVIVVILAF